MCASVAAVVLDFDIDCIVIITDKVTATTQTQRFCIIQKKKVGCQNQLKTVLR